MHNYVQNILKTEISLSDIELSGLTGKIWIDAMFVIWMRCRIDHLSAYLHTHTHTHTFEYTGFV